MCPSQHTLVSARKQHSKERPRPIGLIPDKPITNNASGPTSVIVRDIYAAGEVPAEWAGLSVLRGEVELSGNVVPEPHAEQEHQNVETRGVQDSPLVIPTEASQANLEEDDAPFDLSPVCASPCGAWRSCL